MGVVWVSTEIKACNGILRTTVRLRAPPPLNLKEIKYNEKNEIVGALVF